MPVEPDLMELIRCPRCRGRLAERDQGATLECGACRVAYPVIDGIPQLLADEARPIEAVG